MSQDSHFTISIKCLSPVDAVVFGSSTGAVAAAMELHKRGKTVLAISDKSAFGDETAGALNLSGEGLNLEDEMVRAMFAQRHGAFALPGAIKRALETELLRAAVPFLYWVRPVAVLRSEAGVIGGLLLAARTSLFAVRCGSVIDASRFGLVTRLAGVPLSILRAAQETVNWNILARVRPTGWTGASPVGGNITLPAEKEIIDYQCWKLRAPLPSGSGIEPVDVPHLIRSGLVDSNVAISAETLPLFPEDGLAAGAGAMKDDAGLLADSNFAASPGLFVMNGLLLLSSEGLAGLERADVQTQLGRRVGAIVADSQRAVSSSAPLTLTPAAPGTEFSFSPVFLRNPTGEITIPLPAFPSLGSCDVAVAGGGTGGAGAGIGAARSGAKTVVLEIQHGLGGVGTLGLIASYWFGNRVGFTEEIDKRLRKLDPERVNQSRWNPELKMALYHQLLREVGGRAWMHSFAFGVRKDGQKVTGLLVSTPFGAGLLETGCVVDASGSADIAAAAGAPCRSIDARHAAVQGTGLSPRNPGIDCYNTDHTFIDDHDPEGVTHAFVNARAKFPGEFDTAPFVNSRERRQIVGDIELSPLDFLAGRTFPDTIVTAKSNFDTHGFTVHPVFMIVPPHKKPLEAHVPFRCMLPRGIEGVVVTGLGMSAHRDALPVIRMQADVQNQGFAAGLATARAARDTEGRLRALDIRALQRELADLHIVDASVPEHQDSFPLALEILQDSVKSGARDLFHSAMLLAHPEQSRPLLLDVMRNDSDPARMIDAALMLGLMGDAAAAPALVEAVREMDWDTGWNYTGMGQFGMSTSRLDALIIALGRTGDLAVVAVIEAKIRALDEVAAFSHCRAVAVAASCLRAARLAPAFHELLQRLGMQGHAQLDSRSVAAIANSDGVETSARNLSLRELYLARGLFASGDIDAAGQRILETYSHDLRGVFARHAVALLQNAGSPLDALEIS